MKHISTYSTPVKTQAMKLADKFVSVPEAASHAEITRQAMWRNVQRGSIVATRIGNRYLVPMSQVRALIRRRQSALV